jgi:hypothetical protein
MLDTVFIYSNGYLKLLLLVCSVVLTSCQGDEILCWLIDDNEIVSLNPFLICAKFYSIEIETSIPGVTYPSRKKKS